MSKLQELIEQYCPDGVEYKTLDDLFDKQGGYTPSKSNPEFWEGGDIPWFRMEDIRAHGTVLDDSIQHVTQAAVKRNGLFKAGSIMVATSATIGFHAMVTCDFLCNQRFTCITLKSEQKGQFDVRFLNYYCDQLDRWCESHLNKGTFLSVNMAAFGEFRFAVPPIEVQREIVRLLDAYTAAHDALVQKLNEEMELQAKSLATYREALLTFAERERERE